MAFVLMINYSRSGGTLLNKCLGVLPDAIVLSEVHEQGGGWGIEKEKSQITVWDQAKYWYNIDIEARNFIDAIKELNAYCVANKKHLIIREWTYLNFNSNNYYGNNPSNKLDTLAQLSPMKPIVFAFVRNSIDVWLSSGRPSIGHFFKRYLSYVDELVKANIRVFKYEDFVKDPDKILRQICDYTGLEYNPNTLRDYHRFDNVNGDVQKGEKSRGIRQREIKPLKRKRLALHEIDKINNALKMVEANRKLNYPTNYFEDKNKDYFKWIIYQSSEGNLFKLQIFKKKKKIKACVRKMV
jgi:hypothetical protein